ncbi:hypothetical protein RhiirA5_422191 [Rhizophagus irregularis]|uniref:Uncharacterized protein n=1 Tax=Rhizophagus irregularis TaxID=588596 RepID=A0A2N0PCD1_9GLOM|nr:hypothetical protein RhiirA5_422191 [Rhizophagus irregularis]
MAKCNYVIPVTNTSGVLENYYGDEVLYSNQINAISSLDITIDCLMHMLVYIRESNINEVFSPVVPEDIPMRRLLDRSGRKPSLSYYQVVVVVKGVVGGFLYNITEVHTNSSSYAGSLVNLFGCAGNNWTGIGRNFLSTLLMT